MKTAENVERLIRKFCSARRSSITTSSKMDRSVVEDAVAAFEKSGKQKLAVRKMNVWRFIMESRGTKVAVAALIIIGVLVGINRYCGSKPSGPKEDQERGTEPSATPLVHENKTGPETAPERAVVDAGPDIRENIEAMLAANDVDGLVTMVAKGDLRSQVAAANYLAKMDDGVKALKVLEKLNATYAKDDPYNPFTIAVVNTRNRADNRRTSKRVGGIYPRPTKKMVSSSAPAAEKQPVMAAGAVHSELDISSSSDVDEERETPREVLFGKVVDERGYPVAGGRVFGSYAQHGRTDANGSFALLTSPHDSELGPSDFPMFVWAYQDNDPYRVAWTVVRHPESVSAEFMRKYTASSMALSEQEWNRIKEEMQEYPLVEETHQGVRLDIEDEDDLARDIPGDPGELFGDLEDDPKVRDIVLAMGPAGVITGRVADANGTPVAGATVRIVEWTMQLGTSTLTINNLDHEWKADAYAVTDNYGNYQLGNLPISWTSIQLRALLEDYGSGQAEYQGNGSNIVSGCDIQLLEGEQAYSEEEDDERDVVDIEHFEETVADGYPVRGGGSSVGSVVPTALYENLALYYSFYSDSDPTSVTDISGRGFQGQVQVSSEKTDGPDYSQDEVLSGAMWFEDNGQIVVQDVYLKEFTFSAWVSPTTEDLNNRRIFLLSDGSDCYALQGNASGGIGVYVADGVEVNEYNWRLVKDKWTHVTVTHDGRTFGIYKNGQLTESGAIETDGVTGTLYVGGTDQHDGDHWRGMIDEVAVFNRALSEAEVSQLFGMTGKAGEVR